jgi:uncharacterized protein
LRRMTTPTGLSRDEILTCLRGLEPLLRAKGVTSLAIFGSRSRGDARSDSDLDVLVDVDAAIRNPLYLAFEVQDIVHDALGIDIEATLREGLGERIAARIADDVIEVF